MSDAGWDVEIAGDGSVQAHVHECLVAQGESLPAPPTYQSFRDGHGSSNPYADLAADDLVARAEHLFTEWPQVTSFR